eukprot:245884_1
MSETQTLKHQEDSDHHIVDIPMESPHQNIKYIRCEHMRQIVEMLITDLQTHEKYRIIQILTTCSQFLDNGAFISLVIVLFVLSDPKDSTDTTNDVEANMTLQNIIENPFLFVVMIADAFYGILISKVHLWIVQRTYLYIILLFHLFYIISFSLKNMWTPMILLLYLFRVLSYIFTTFITYCFDLEIAYDLAEKQIHKLWKCNDYTQMSTRYNNQTTERLVNLTKRTKDEPYIMIMHDTRIFYFKCSHSDNTLKDIKNMAIDADNLLEFPGGTKYCGSICVWSVYNVFKYIPVKENINTNKCNMYWITKWSVRVLIATIPFLIEICLFLVAGVLSLAGYLFCTVFGCCNGESCKKLEYREWIIGELLHNKSV